MKKIIIFQFLLFSLIMGETVAQQGFSDYHDYRNDPSYLASTYHSLYADTHQIILSGITFVDTVGFYNQQVITFIAAKDYEGNLLWEKRLAFEDSLYERNENMPFYTLDKIDENKYAIGANSKDPYTRDDSFYLVNPFLYIFDSQGDSVQFIPLPYDNPDEIFILNGLLADRQKNIWLTGKYTNKTTFADTLAIWLAKVDSAGDFLWRKVIYNTEVAFGAALSNKIIEGNQDHEYILAGRSYSLNANYTVHAIWKVDSAGNLIWKKNIPKTPDWQEGDLNGGSYLDLIKAQDGSGYYFMTTAFKRFYYPGDPPSYRTVYYCGKLDEEGEVAWAKTYEQDTSIYTNTRSYGLLQKENGDLLFWGSNGASAPPAGPSIFCTDSSGRIKWTKITANYNHCNPALSENLYTARLTPDGNGIVRAGFVSQRFPRPDCLDSLGTLSWLVYTDSLARIDENDTQAFTLHEHEVDYSDTATGIATAPQKVAFSFSPNPTKNKIYINIKGFKGNIRELDIECYDYTGKMLFQRKMNHHEKEIDLSPYLPGLYLFKWRYKGQYMGEQKVIKI